MGEFLQVASTEMGQYIEKQNSVSTFVQELS